MKSTVRPRLGSLLAAFTISAAAAAADQPLAKPALVDERLGAFPADGFRLVDGRCSDCPAARQALWYFENDLIAVPAGAGADARPNPVWVGSPEIVEHAQLAADTLSDSAGRRLAFAPVARLATNRSYFDARSVAFFGGRALRVRGRTLQGAGGAAVFEARTIWPEDLSLDERQSPRPLRAPETLGALIEAEDGGAGVAANQRFLWRNPGATSLAGKPAFSLVLSGAQGDDDEAHGGHFAVATGILGDHGEWSSFLVNNFYNLDSVSEKGIVAAMTPMDKYLMDLNSGQAYYRPNQVLTVVLADGAFARGYQARVQRVYERFYRHQLLYDHSSANCAGISMDTLRAGGWNVPRRGPTSYPKATAAFFFLLATERSVASGEKTYDYLTQEQTRLLPRVAFEAAGEDLLAVLEGRRDRTLTPDEKALRDDVLAVVLVRMPQVPSSRAPGTYAIRSFDQYRGRVPKDRSQWKIIPVAPRPFPAALHDGPVEQPRKSRAVPVATTTGFVALGVVGTTARLVRRRLRAVRRTPAA